MAYNHIASSEAAYTAIKDKILHLELPPGTALSETDTAALYNISRTPVRDAFKRLEREGLLEIQPHVGTFVSLIDINAVADVLYIRDVLEYAALSDLSASLDKSQELRIRLLLKQQSDLIDSDMEIEELSRAFIKCDNEFHAALLELAGRKSITAFLYSFNSQYERFRTFINYSGREDIKKLYDAHCRIWECILAKDLTTLKDCLTHHLYDGFSGSSSIVSKYPEYFKAIH